MIDSITNAPKALGKFWNHYVMKRESWWIPLLIVMLIGVSSMLFVGTKTYTKAPPIPDFVTQSGEMMFTSADVTKGQTVFLQKALMEYGSFFGDGAGRGPDFTAQALHFMSLHMEEFYLREEGIDPEHATRLQKVRALSRVQYEIKENTYDENTNTVILSAGQAYAFTVIRDYYVDFFSKDGEQYFKPNGYIKDPESLHALTAFFYWGGWVCGAERPGQSYSYTHNWPFDEHAGNTPKGPIVFWSVIATLCLMLAFGAVLFLYGRYSTIAGWTTTERKAEIATHQRVATYIPTAIQKATYKFFAVALVLFVLQVSAGILTVHDFLGFTKFGNVDLSKIMPITVTRSWHLQLALLWISACWVGASIFVLSTTFKTPPRGQLKLINLTFTVFAVMVAGNMVGLFMGPLDMLGKHWNLLGNQGWELVELGKLWQGMLFVVLALWTLILARYVLPTWNDNPPFTLPKWMLFSVGSIMLLFISGFVATPETNFVIADFWRWAVVHMWAEAFFEVFATIVLGYFMYLMGFVSHSAVSRIVYIAVLLFLGSGLLGISHNFYWNAKPIETLAIGSIFSTLQVVPLILLTLEAWNFRNTPKKLIKKDKTAKDEVFGQKEAFLFLIAVNFWNFFGAGVFGFIINLPIVNYYEHGTYLTVNHGHAALMGVYGNLSLAAVVFCSRYLIKPERWNMRLISTAFWSINIGLMLMVLIDLFPVGINQLITVLDHGFWYARSAEFVEGSVFQTLTWARIVGGATFVLGGVLPLAWFMVSRITSLKEVEG